MPDLFSPYDPKDHEEVMEKPKPAPVADKKPEAVAKEELPLHRDAVVHVPNVRRSRLTVTGRHLFISFATSVVAGLIVLHAARNYVDQRLGASALPPAAASVPAAPADDIADAAAEQIAALQKQVDVLRREQLLLQQNTRESLESISETLKNPKLVPQPPTAAAEQPGVPRIADMKPDISPTQQEFILLKERNRLAQYADEAIATGMRKPLEVLVEYMRDPDAKHLHEAAKAEYLRAVRSVQFIQREDPGYRLPVAELFKDQTIRDEADVKPDALLKLLADHQQPWEVRLRVCFLLLGSELPETNAKLIQAIKEDPSLDVAKHAQFALEQRIKRRFRIFDIPAIEAWAESQKK
jgi:hypothetical protein